MLITDVSTLQQRVLIKQKERSDWMQLDDRKTKILQAIIRNYLETGEPVGSRTISKYSDLKLSSATIRNEMSDLEEMGFIVQPHTSAGRIPSDKGYRLYVDQMMEEKEREVTEMKELMIQKADRMESLLQQVAKVLAHNTNYATMISSPQYHHNKVKFIQLSEVDETQDVYKRQPGYAHPGKARILPENGHQPLKHRPSIHQKRRIKASGQNPYLRRIPGKL